ncbi:MAG: aspartate carbamoyltransferase [Kiritimatiellaeota bacterium]|nr:aspartate carbamoyltransferase [Kiritimatiellota bacterium]
MRLMDCSGAAFEGLPIQEKVPLLAQRDGMPFHTLFAQQFTRPVLDELCALATEIRTIAKARSGMQFLQSQLCHKRAMLYFSQPSSRTFLSFLSACQILGISTGELRDSATSSEFKGESCEDSVRTFSSYFDLIIMRTPEKGLAEHMAWVLSGSERPVPIINAGSGQDQHPTQALLDIYTLQRSFERRGGLRNRRVVFVGDLLRGRTVRSLSALLMNYEEIEQVFVAPEALQIGEDVRATLKANGVRWRMTSDMRSVLPEADALYMTRVQDEWDTQKGDSAAIDISKFHIGVEEMKLMRPDAILMHPLPRRSEIAVEVDRDPRAMYWRQMRNGMWIRTALIAATFGCASRIHEFYKESV